MLIRKFVGSAFSLLLAGSTFYLEFLLPIVLLGRFSTLGVILLPSNLFSEYF